MTQNSIVWDPELIQKYNLSGPRYTSYPTALEFKPEYDEIAFRRAACRYPERSLSLYIHIPFCHKLCYFCGCNKVVTRQKHKADQYLMMLAQEIAFRAPLFANRQISQMHWGGGTPTYLTKTQISQLMALLRKHFTFLPEAELSIEIDPREIELDVIDHLRHEGFNRLSMGVQDFNKEVQRLVNREQDEAFIFDLIARAKSVGFHSTNIDLIYGLPLQTPESFAFTLQRVIALLPDRLSVFNYAHLPTLFAAQRKIKEHHLPTAQQKLAILRQTIAMLTAAGYQFIGMDHFARPDDELAIAQKAGKLHRNFQGYTTQNDSDLLGLGVSAISMLGDSYAQNQKELKAYYQSVDAHGHALQRGLAMSKDDCLRRDVIKSLICNFKLLYQPLEQQYNICFTQYFSNEIKELKKLAQDGLINIAKQGLEVTPQGRLLVRNICMCFDAYLTQAKHNQKFSRVI